MSASVAYQDLFPSQSGTADEDQILVAQIRQGNERAFEALFHKYYVPLWAMVAGYVGSPEIAKECVQDVLLSVWQQRSTWHIRDTVRAYLYQAARNAASNHRRSQDVRDRWAHRATYDLSVSGMGQGPELVEHRVADAELTVAVREAVQRLPARRREAFTLRWHDNLSNAAIAARMGVTVKCVEIHLAHALKSMRQALLPLLG